MAEVIPDNINLHIQEAKQTPNCINIKKSMPYEHGSSFTKKMICIN